MNTLTDVKLIKELQKKYRAHRGQIQLCSTDTFIPRSNSVRLTLSETRCTYNYGYIMSILLHSAESLPFSVASLSNAYCMKGNNILSRRTHTAIKDRFISARRITVEGKRYTVPLHLLVNVLSASSVPSTPNKKPEAKKREYTPQKSKQLDEIKSTYTAGVVRKTYSGPIGDVAEFSSMFTKVKQKMFSLHTQKNLANMSTLELESIIRQAITADMNKIISGWVTLHKFKARTSTLSQY